MSITTQYDRPSRCRHCNSRLWPFPCCKCVPTMSNDFRTTLPGGGSRGVSGGGSRGVSGGRSNVSGSMMLEKIRSNFRKGGSSNGKRVVSKLTTDGSAGSLSLPTPSPSRKKRAVLCGVTYRSTRRHRLKGTVNDVRCMKQMLIERFGFSEENIVVLTEEERRIPTKENILQALSWLVNGCTAGDSLVFFFSGHGVRQQESVPGDEIDGFDETILPVDFKDQGTIIDDKINSIIVRPLPSGATLHAIVDSCHSGTILDLPYVYDYRLGKWIDNKPPSGTFKGTSGGLAISLSACSDEEVASDTSLMSGKFMTGAMTYSFIQAITKKQTITYGELMHSIHEAIKGANSKSSCLTFRRSKLLQEPMLSSSEIFDVNKKLFEL